MSDLRNLPPLVLVQICSLLRSENFDFHNPYDDYIASENALKNSSKWADVSVEYLDVEFISKFFIENETILEEVFEKKINPKTIIENLILPIPKNFVVYYEIWGPATLTEKYKKGWESYDKEWAEAAIRQNYYDGNFDYYQGEYIEYETDNFEPDNFEVTRVRLNETKKNLLSKIIVENTSEVLENLDEETLHTLRNMINQRLSSF